MADMIYYGRGSADMYDDFIDFINYVFSFNGNEEDFKKLLPKLYRPELNPVWHNYVAVEDGRIKAAIGAYDQDLKVCGKVLKTRGIGNVAVHPYSRSKGYMKKLMNMAVDGMVEDGVVLSTLGGRRQRYNYFSYDKCGVCLRVTVNSDNVRHTFGRERTAKFRFSRVGREDAKTLSMIRSLSESVPYYALRNNADYYDILTSWQFAVRAAYVGDKFAGYAIELNGNVAEFMIVPEFENDARKFIADLFDALGRTLSLTLPLFLKKYVSQLITLGESYNLSVPETFSVLNYKEVTEAFLKLKLTYCTLPDGEITFSIDGRGGKENITVSVKEGKPSVRRTKKKAFCELGHLEAMNLLFAPYCPERESLPDFARVWFPLPLFLYHTDAV